ncbi:MAG TPA: hypothetical protein EYP18_06725 [Desulfobacterales bacterium]|nr:hypothetical protein [Desulfobacterales bacterium]
MNPGLIYKKVDSCLCGNISQEIDAILDAFPGQACFFAPAYPDQGRATIRGIH